MDVLNSSRAGRQEVRETQADGLHNQQLGGGGLAEIVRMVEEQGGLTGEKLQEIIEIALVRTYQLESGLEDGVRAEFSLETGDYHLFLNSRPEEDAELPLPKTFQREAALAVRHAITKEIMRAISVREQSLITKEIGTLQSMVATINGGDGWWLRTEDREAWLPSSEQIPGEVITPHSHIQVVVEGEVRKHGKTVALVSRIRGDLVTRLLEREIPEVANGVVSVVGVAREAGVCSKVAVVTQDHNVDARGACLGRNGVRHQAVVGALSGEQVHIVDWSPDPEKYVSNAMTPAAVSKVTIDDENKVATVLVPLEQMSLAIGKGGINAKLVARLTGLRINVVEG